MTHELTAYNIPSIFLVTANLVCIDIYQLYCILILYNVIIVLTMECTLFLSQLSFISAPAIVFYTVCINFAQLKNL